MREIITERSNKDKEGKEEEKENKIQISYFGDGRNDLCAALQLQKVFFWLLYSLFISSILLSFSLSLSFSSSFPNRVTSFFQEKEKLWRGWWKKKKGGGKRKEWVYVCGRMVLSVGIIGKKTHK